MSLKKKCLRCGKDFTTKARGKRTAKNCSMQCAKGNLPAWNRGIKATDEHRKKISDAKKKNPSGYRWGKGDTSREKNKRWKGGKWHLKVGYVMILLPDHHRANKRGYVYEHIVVAEKKYGRLILKGEVVHHINRKKDDNRPENLILFSSLEEHTKHHDEDRKRNEKGQFDS